MRVVGCGGGSYFGLSFYKAAVSVWVEAPHGRLANAVTSETAVGTHLVFLALIITWRPASCTRLLVTLGVVSISWLPLGEEAMLHTMTPVQAEVNGSSEDTNEGGQ